jgi:hypothetical protein
MPWVVSSAVKARPKSVSVAVAAGADLTESEPRTLDVHAVQWSGVFSSQSRS